MLNTRKLQLGNTILNVKDNKNVKIESLQGDCINGIPSVNYKPIELSSQALKSFFHISSCYEALSYTSFELVKNNFEVTRIHKYLEEDFFRVGINTSENLIVTHCYYVHELQNLLNYCDFYKNEETEK